MVRLETLIVLLSGSISLCLIFYLCKILHKLWWKPMRIQHLMASQGIRGPPYRFFYGNSKEMIKMRTESMKTPLGLSAHNLFPKILPHTHSWINTYGMTVLTWIGPQAYLLVTEPEMIKEILNNRNGNYPKTKPEGYIKKILGDGLVTSSGEKWAKSRKLANYAFHAESLKNMIPEMIERTEMMLEQWKDHEGKEIDVAEEFRLLTSEVISRTAFGSSYREGKNIFEMLNTLIILLNRNFYKPKIPGISKIWKTSDEIESEKIEKGMHDSIRELIQKREEEIIKGEVDNYGTDFLGMLVKAYHDADESKRMMVADVIDDCKTFYVAGQETTNTLLSWTVLLLAIHTDWQEEARKEVLQSFGNENPKADGIAKLKIMTMIINESLRLYPPIVSMPRRVQREVRLGKLSLPAGLNLSIPILKLQTDPKTWGQDAHLFKPERFSEGVAKATNNDPAAFFPFGMGPRTCVGMNFAVNEAKIVMSMILQRYSFSLSPAYVHSPFQFLTVQPQHGLQVFLQKL